MLERRVRYNKSFPAEREHCQASEYASTKRVCDHAAPPALRSLSDVVASIWSHIAGSCQRDGQRSDLALGSAVLA
eukprot:3832693-Pleurochrysis_carterae.AAC.3